MQTLFPIVLLKTCVRLPACLSLHAYTCAYSLFVVVIVIYFYHYLLYCYI